MSTSPQTISTITYTATASDTFGGYDPWKAFNKVNAVPTDRWNATGTGTYTTTNITGGSSATATGSWLQLQLSTGIIMKSYTFVQTEAGTAMTGWLMLGSNNGTNWVQIDSRTGTSGWGTPNQVTYSTPSNMNSYTYYRVVAQAGTSTMYEWRLFA
jgi:hypothetical protein